MLWLLVSVWLIFGCPIAYGSEKSFVQSINFKGNQAINEQQLLRCVVTQPNSVLSLPQLSNDFQSILNLYNQNGFYFAEVRIESLNYNSDSSGVDIFLKIEEGDQAAIGDIAITGNSVFDTSEILQMFDTKNGDFLVPKVLEEDINLLIVRYEKVGFPFAKVGIKDVFVFKAGTSSKLRVDISIEEGPKVTIDEIQVKGNTITKENVVVRETRLRPHEVYDPDKVLKISSRLNRLNIFSKVEEPELYLTSKGGGLLINVREDNTNTFDGIIGYAPPSTNIANGTITGMIDVSMRNLFGTARKFHVRWQNDERNSQEIELQYVEPWVFDYPINLGGSFNQRQQDTIYVKRAFEAKVDLLLTESFTIGGMFIQENVIPSNSVNAVTKSRTTFTGIDIQYDNRDDILSPTSGAHYRSGYQIGSKKILDQNSTVQRISVDADFFISTFQHQVLMLGLHGRSLSSSRIELSDLYRFGGTNTLRGYRENQFLGSRVAWTNTEYRFLLERRSFFYGFFDTGYYYFPGDDTKNVASSQKVKYGYGIGVHLETALGNIGVSFAFGEGDSFLQGKIHIGLINEF